MCPLCSPNHVPHPNGETVHALEHCISVLLLFFLQQFSHETYYSIQKGRKISSSKPYARARSRCLSRMEIPLIHILLYSAKRCSTTPLFSTSLWKSSLSSASSSSSSSVSLVLWSSSSRIKGGRFASAAWAKHHSTGTC